MSLNLDKSVWRRVAFGDVARNINETVKDAESAGIDRVIAMEHLDPGELNIERWGSVADGTTFTRKVKPGQTLFGKRRAYQRKVAYAEFEAICSGDIYTFEADDAHMLGELLPFLVQSDRFFDHALGTSAGSLSPRTNWRDLANFEFDLPPLDEQKRIADLLWAVERHSRSLTSLLGLEITSGRAAFSRLIQSVGSEARSLGDVGRFTRGRRFTKADYVGEGLGCVHYAQIHTDFDFSASTALTYVPESMRSSLRLAHAGELIVAGTSEDLEGVGKAVAWFGDDVAVHDDCFIYSHGLDPKFVSYLFASAEFDHEKRSHVSESKVVRLASSSLAKMVLPVPDTAGQQEVVGTMDELKRAMGMVSNEKASGTLLARSLSAAIFGGN